MKKRKELNALIGLGDSKRKKTKKGSGHRLLRTEPPDSESESSSDDDDFNNLNSGANFGKRSYTQCCNVCYPLFLFIILAACVMACAGLIWMQIALKEDLDSLKEKLHSMESSQKTSSSEIPKLSEDLKNKEKKLDDIENGGKGLSKLWSNLTEMNRKISLLDSAVNHLKANLKSAADLISLPTTVEELQKSVATIGSTLTSVQHDVKTMQAALENQKKDDDLKKAMDITDLRKAMGEVNKTEEQHHTWTDEQIHILLSTVADLHQRVASLENRSKQSVSKTRLHTLHFEFMWHLEDIFQQVGVGRSLRLTYQDLRKLFGESTPSNHAMLCFDSDGDQRYSLVELKAALGL
uniref:EF-hand domain-containing protein n=1 Tax=Amphiprion ocellaris TaxID=80972 RepID=A0AAQ5ZGW2_AMPOC